MPPTPLQAQALALEVVLAEAASARSIVSAEARKTWNKTILADRNTSIMRSPSRTNKESGGTELAGQIACAKLRLAGGKRSEFDWIFNGYGSSFAQPE